MSAVWDILKAMKRRLLQSAWWFGMVGVFAEMFGINRQSGFTGL